MRYQLIPLLLCGVIGFMLPATPALASPLTTPGDHSGMIVGAPARPADDIHPVQFTEIDGDRLIPRDVLWLKPGQYELTVRTIATEQSRILPRDLARWTRRNRDTGYNRIEVVVEAGKKYYVGARFDRTDWESPYSIVLYRVEE